YYSLSPLTPRVLHSFPTRRSSDLQTELLTELLAEHLPGVTFHPPKASFLAWLDFRDTDLTEEPADFFLREARVALSPGNSFGTVGAGRVRLNMGTSTERLERIIVAMGKAWSSR